MANIYIPDAGGNRNRLPHFTNVPVAVDLWEPIYANLFEVNFILPDALNNQGRNSELLMYNATNISFPLTPEIGTTTQRYKYSTRAYVTMPEGTHLPDVKINMNINQSNQNAVVVWNTLKAWYDLVWNSQTGELNYKRDIVGTLIANQHDRRGEIIRQVTFYNAQLRGISSIELSWDTTDIITNVETTFVADYWEDLYIDELADVPAP